MIANSRNIKNPYFKRYNIIHYGFKTGISLKYYIKKIEFFASYYKLIHLNKIMDKKWYDEERKENIKVTIKDNTSLIYVGASFNINKQNNKK